MSLDKLASESPHPGQQPQLSKGSASTSNPRTDTSRMSGSATPAFDTSVDRNPVAYQPLKIGDRVFVFNKKKVPVFGTVRCLGTDILTRKVDNNYIGIETVSNFFQSHAHIYEH